MKLLGYFEPPFIYLYCGSNKKTERFNKLFAIHFCFSDDFDLLANWAVMGLMIFLPLDIWLLNRFGLRPAVLFGKEKDKHNILP